jgi:hypothetical protein
MTAGAKANQAEPKDETYPQSRADEPAPPRQPKLEECQATIPASKRQQHEIEAPQKELGFRPTFIVPVVAA